MFYRATYMLIGFLLLPLLCSLSIPKAGAAEYIVAPSLGLQGTYDDNVFFFEVDDYEHFVMIQSEAAVRKMAGEFPYDNLEDEDAKITLRGGKEEVNKLLEDEITERLSIAGIHVIEARINYLAYAQPTRGFAATVVISLMENEEVEVRILRPDDDLDDQEDTAIFGVFRLGLVKGCDP